MAFIRTLISRYRAPLLGASLFLCILGYVAYADLLESITTEETIHILPLSITEDGWNNTEALYVQDVREFDLYESFSRRNSAYLSDDASYAPTQIEQVVPNEPAEPNVIDETPTDVDASTPDDSSSSDIPTSPDDSAVVQDVVEPSLPPEPIPEPEAPPEVTAPQAPVETPSEPSAFAPMTTFVSRLYDFFPLTALDTVEGEAPLPDGGMSIPPPTPEIVNEASLEQPQPVHDDTTAHTMDVEPGVPDLGTVPDSESASTTEQLNSTSTTDGVAPEQVSTPEQSGIPEALLPNGPRLTWNGFSLPALTEREAIANAQIRLSLGAQRTREKIGTEPAPRVRIDFTFGDGLWQNAGTISIDDQVSNALNGGYYLFALPPILDPVALRSLEVRATYLGARDDVEAVYIDSLWIELSSMRLDRAALEARVAPGALTQLEKPEMHELISDTLDFTPDELPQFTLKYEEQRALPVRLIRGMFAERVADVTQVTFTHSDLGEIDVPYTLNETNDGIWSIQMDEEARTDLRPGTYAVDITVNEGSVTFTDRFEFQWGLLAINTKEARYRAGDTAEISLAALSENGNTLCDAKLELYAITEDDFIRRLPVVPSGLCNGNTVVPVPDYTSTYGIAAPGTYELYVEHVADDGSVLAHESMTVEVVADAPFELARSGPTRIYPVAPYDMTLTLTARDGFTGTVTERVPRGFVLATTSSGVAAVDDVGGAIEWEVVLAQGESASLSYTFDAPDVSPYLYELGPATVEYQLTDLRNGVSENASTTDVAASVDESTTLVEATSTDTTTETGIASDAASGTTTTIDVPVDTLVNPLDGGSYTEHRRWQVASDATGSMLLYWASTTIPTGWTCVSCAVSDVFYQRFVVGSATPSVNGGAATHTHTATATLAATAAAGVSSTGGGGADAAVLAHGHSLTPTVGNANNLPPYRNFAIIQHNSAGEPATIPAGAIAMFDATVPSGWTQYSLLNGLYPRGEATTTILSAGGSTTHTHLLTGTTGASDINTNAPGAAGVSTAANTHTHTINASSSSATSEPPYIEAVFGRMNATTTATDGMIAMWTDTPPTGWGTVSSSSEPFVNRFVKASTTYGGTGGSSTHAQPVTTGIVSSGPSATVNRTANAANADASGAHTHVVTVGGFSTVSHVPPYRTAIFAKRAGGAPSAGPTQFEPFESELTGTSTPRLEFAGNDPDGADTLTYHVQWDDDENLDDEFIGSSTSSDESGCSPNCFENIVTPADTSPFNDNERIGFTIQDPLTSGVTYYWRVRARETGSTQWGNWSETWSFTYVVDTDPAEWYQTEAYQFMNGSTTAVATSSDSAVLNVLPPSEALIAYGEGVVTTPRYRVWSGSGWGSENSAADVGGIVQWIRLKANPARDEYILGVQDASNDVNFQIFASTSVWGNLIEATTTVTTNTRRSFDVAYETTSGDAIAVYCGGSTNARYRVWNGTSWTGPFDITTASANQCEYVQMASDPNSDEIIAVFRDTGAQYEALVWDGSTWAQSRTLGSMAETDNEGIAVEYEASGDQALVVASDGGNNQFIWNAWSGTSWNGTNATVGLGDDFEWGVLRRDEGTDTMALCYVDNDNDVGYMYWNGLSWQTPTTELSISGSVKRSRPISCEFETTSGRDGYLLHTYGETARSQYQYSTTSIPVAAATVTNVTSAVVGSTRTGEGDILTYYHTNGAASYVTGFWNGSVWSTSTIETSHSVTAAPHREALGLASELYQSGVGTLVTEPVDFDNVPGQPTWGEVTWNTTEPTGTDIKLQVVVGPGCTTTVPDLALPGNSAGFEATSSPLNISGLSTSTYNQICLKATFTSSNTSNPTLDDWRISWERRPVFVQKAYRWYDNANALTPTDPWPAGVSDIAESTPIDESSPSQTGSVLRLRLGIENQNVTLAASQNAFRLQYASTTASACTDTLIWQDVGAIGSSTAEWRGYNNAAVSDGATLSTLVLTEADTAATYEEQNDSALNPNSVTAGNMFEYDWVLENNAEPGVEYCFRQVSDNGEVLNDYTSYPLLITNADPEVPTLEKLFDNEKTPTTTPRFEFLSSDTEGNDISYQIQIDDDAAFGSVNVDRQSDVNTTQFTNLTTPADKDPFTNGERIEFRPTSAFTDGTTYYWRVRAKDPDGSNDWSEWSTVWSFTIDTSLTASAWFQTTDAQFETNTLEDTESSGSNSTRLQIGFAVGTTTSDAISFEDGSVGNAWGSLTFTDVETSSDLKYFIEYFADDVWSLIPDNDLAGNSAGFDSSPVNLLGLDTDTYGTIRLVARLTDSGASPQLQDWTINWGFKILPPTISKLFPNERQATTTPTFEFYAEDPQNNDVAYEVQWSTTYDFSASTTRTSSTSAGFANVDTPADTTSPYFSGDRIQFTIQPADALLDNTTYWWRVRAIDPPPGENNYSAYTDPQSFTVSSSTVVSTWFQTTQSQFDTDLLSGATTTSVGSVTVATTAVESLIAYAEGTQQAPRYRTWNGTGWTSEDSALSVGSAIAWVVTKPGATREEYVLGTLGTDGDVNVQVYADGTWGDLQELTASVPNTTARGFDIAYETISGDAVAVTCDGDSDPEYWVWNGTTWTDTGSVNLLSTNNCAWVKLASDPQSDEIVLVARDTSGTSYELFVWNGSSWGNNTRLGSMNEPGHEGISLAYEESGNQAVVVTSSTTNAAMVWKSWNGSSWTGTSSVALGNDFEGGMMASDVGSDNMVFCYVDENNDIGVVRWNGTGWVGAVELETLWANGNTVKNDLPISCAFEVGGARDGFIMAAYSDTTNIRYQFWNGTAWSIEDAVSTMEDAARVQLVRTGGNVLQLITYDITNNRYDFSSWNGTTWSVLQTLETSGSSGGYPYKEPFMIGVREPGSTASIVGDPQINFYDGSGPYWRELAWANSSPGSSTILYRVQYYDTASSTWKDVPNALIPGNLSGTTTSPIDLRNVLPVSTYSLLRPVAALTCVLSNCPTHNDWTLTWAPGINLSGTARQYNQSTNLTSGTVAVALNGVLQVGKTGTISGGTWSISNVNASEGDTLTVFIDGAADSGEAIAVTTYDGVGDVTGMDLYERHLSIGSDDKATTTNAQIGLYDRTNDEDLFADVSSGALTLCASGETACQDGEIIVKSLNTYQPGSSASVTTHDFENNGTFVPNGNTIRVNGSWDNNGTTTMATSTVIFTATSTIEYVDSTGSISSTWNNITFGETSGTATWNASSTLDIDGNLAVNFGTLSRSAQAITIAGNLSTGANGFWSGIASTTFDGTAAASWSDANATRQNVGYAVIDGSSKVVTLTGNVAAQTVTIGANDTLDANTPTSYDVTVYGHWTNNNIWNARSGEVIFAATTTGRVISLAGATFYDLTFNGVGGAWSFASSTLSITNDLAVATGTVTLPTGTTTIAGSFLNTGGTFQHNNGEVRFTSTGAETVTLASTAFTNGFYDLSFSGSGGTWNMTDASATTSNNVRIFAGTPTFPNTRLSIGGSFINSGGSFSGNGGELRFYGSSDKTITAGGGTFASLRFDSTATSTLTDTNVTALGSLTINAGTTTLPSGTLTLGGSLLNSSVFAHSNGTILFNSTDTGELVTVGSSTLYNATFNGPTGGWTITGNATATNAFTIASTSTFTLQSGRTLSVGGTFTNSGNGASTTWSGSTLMLVSGTTFQTNAVNTPGDRYDTLIIGSSTKVSSWNSSATTTNTNTSSYLYSQDNAAIDGDLYIYGAYTRTSGTEYWNTARDFDGTLLATSSMRQVDVRFASGASVALTTATLSVVGTSTASTTVAALSGTYTIDVAGGTTTMQYYDFTNLGTNGITLGTSTIVTSLADGRFVPGIASGSALRVASSTIDANPALQIQRVEFSTTTAITATNVTQFGGTPLSYWWFRNSTGNIDGESFDNDTGNPGSIRWDDSAYVISVSGTVYSDAGVTTMGSPVCDGIASNVRVVVNAGSSTHDGICLGDGTYTVPGVTFVGDPTLTIFLNTNGGARGAVVTKTPTGDLTGIDIYQNRVITRHEDTVALTIGDMAHYDEDNDSDLSFSATTTASTSLAVRGDTELFVYASTTFTPGGAVTLQSAGTGNSYDATLHIDNTATATAQGTEVWSIGGRFQVDSGGTFVPASSTVVMTATSTGKTISSPGTIDLNALTFSGTGSWSLVANLAVADSVALNAGTLSGSGNIDVAYGSFTGNGTLALTGGAVTVARTNTLGGTTPWQFHSLTIGNGSVVGTTTPGGVATTTVLRTLTISAGHILAAGASRWDLRGTTTPFVVTGTFDEGTSFVRYAGDTATAITSDTYYDLDVNANAGTPTFTTGAAGINIRNTLSVGGSAPTTLSFTAADPIVSVVGNLYIRGNGTLIGSDSSLLTARANWDNDGTFTASGGTVTFTGATSSLIMAGQSSFANLIINGDGTHTLSENATATSAFTITQTGGLTVNSGVTLAVGGTFYNNVNGAVTTWTGSTLRLYSGTSFDMNPKSNDDQYGTLVVAPNTDPRMWNSTASSISVDATASLYSMDHANSTGSLYIYGDYQRTTGTDYWSYGTDFDGTALGGSSRKVDVAFASGASAYYTGGGLWLVGTSTASTTVTNQGSGTYSLTIGGTASTTMRYYEMRDMAASGLVFTGTPNVATLSLGDFIVSQSNGSAITVGGSVITQNPAKTFTNNRFATNTAIAAFNVTATGTTVSSWRFTNEVGNLAGEAYDVDPDGDPGYVVWTNSAANITVSGRVYSDEGSTVSGVCDDSTQNIRLVVAGVTTYDAYCESLDGDYSISGVTFSANDTLTVFINGETEKAATVTVDPVSSISDMDLYENRVIVRHENTDPVTIADMAAYDSTDDADVPFTAVDAGSDTLSLPANRKLIIWNAKTFAPGGNVTVTGGGAGAAYDGTLELFTNAVFTAQGTEVHTVGGSMILGTGASLTAAQSTFTFTTTGAARTIDVNQNSFYNVTLNGSGSWTMTDTTLTASNDMTITSGAVTLPVGTTTVGGSFANSGGSFTQTTGTLAMTSTSGGKTLRMGGSTINRLVVNGGGGSWTMTDTNATTTLSMNVIQGSVTLPTGTLSIGSDFTASGTITHNSGTLRLAGTTTSGVLRSGGNTLGSVVMGGSGAYTMTDSSLALAGSLTISSGSMTFATNTLSIAGSLTATGGTFAHASGTVLMNSTDQGETINPGTSRFYNLTFQNAGGGWTVAASATTTNNLTLTSAASFRQASSTTFEVNGVFSNLVGGTATNWDGSTLLLATSATYAINIKSSTGDRYNILDIASSTDVSVWNSNATTTNTGVNASLYSMDHGSVDGELYVFGDYERRAGAEYWNYAIDFDGTVLVGGSRRAVTVRHAANATTTISEIATLNVVGDAAASTTVTNQGSGTFSVRATAGTVNASYYRLRNLGVSGLELLGTTTVSSLSNGDLELAVNGGALITVASSTVNANASAVHSAVRFATTTSITGSNVTLTGTTSAAWTFSGHTGNLSGESYDVDGIDNCGSIRWSDSSCLLLQQAHYRWRADDGGESAPDSEWYDTSWTKRQRVVVTNSDATAYSNAAVKVTVPYDADMQANFGDLRFTSVDGTTLLSHWIEKTTASTQATVWVEVPTLAASGDTSVFMYYGNALASDASSGTTTFVTFDDFEDDNISEYAGDTSMFNVGTALAYDRTYGLDAAGNENSQTTDGIYRTGVTVSQGETIRYFQYITTTTGSTDEACTLFGVQTPGSSNNNYAVCLPLFGVDRVTIAKNVSSNETSGTVLASSTITYATGWHEVEVDWRTNNSIFVSVYRSGTLVATTSVTDSSYTSGGIGFSYWFQHGGWDTIASRPYTTSDPSTRFGVEQTRSGATWLAPIDTFASSFAASSSARVRFGIENTGLAVTGKQFRLEYAEKGVAPSCESVSGGSYVQVPVEASCGSSAICMTNSSNLTDLSSTTDQLGGSGQFTYGQVVENASNKSGSLNLGASTFTEIEYAIMPTSNAVSGSYCLRVTDNGSALDGYTRVAEMRLRYNPTVSSVVLNNGSDIVLTPGATTTVSATATITDLNGYSDMTQATATIYRSGVANGTACAQNDNNCYRIASTSCLMFACSGYSCSLSCSADIFYFADPTDVGTYAGDAWGAFVSVVDTAGGYGTSTASIQKELITLRALEVSQTIDYGSLESQQDTGSYNATTTIDNIGNDAIDISVAGTNLTSGGSVIPVNSQKFATSTFSYSSCTTCSLLATTTTSLEVDLAKPTSPTPVEDDVFWGISIPFGVAATAHQGQNTFYAIGD